MWIPNLMRATRFSHSFDFTKVTQMKRASFVSEKTQFVLDHKQVEMIIVLLSEATQHVMLSREDEEAFEMILDKLNKL